LPQGCGKGRQARFQQFSSVERIHNSDKLDPIASGVTLFLPAALLVAHQACPFPAGRETRNPKISG
jgi:hypothetical protein